MGVDAEMLVRNKGEPLTDKQLRKIAGALCARIGSHRFMIQREGAYDWTPKGGQHALSLVQTLDDVKREYAEEFVTYMAPKIPGDTPPERQVWTQDGDPIVALPNEQFIKVNLFGRYYGPDYERGDWPTIRATAEFLEAVIPGAEIWYGGDSSGMCAELFDAPARDRMNQHFLKHGHDPYRGYFGSMSGRAEVRQTCAFCGDRPMNNSGGGGNRTFWSCDGCGLQRITTPTKSRDLAKDEDFFGAEV